MDGLVLALVLLATLFASANAFHGGFPRPIHLLRQQSGSGGSLDGVSCQSWRLAVETNNIRSWSTVPSTCEDYVGHYMLGDRYRKDCEVVARVAALYASYLNLTGDGKGAWVFDIDETTLSNLPYYAQHGFGFRRAIRRGSLRCRARTRRGRRRSLFGRALSLISFSSSGLYRAEPYNSTTFNAWVELGKLPALPESLKLYKKLLSLGYSVIFLTGRPESQREVTVSNLKSVGYNTWEKLVLRGEADVGKAAVVYKSAQRKKLEDEGYKILGNMGDQWSDILGTNIGNRTFKVPDPMYYIG